MGVQSPEPREPGSGLCGRFAKSGLGWEGGVSGLSGDGRAEEPWPDLRIKPECCVSQRASLSQLLYPTSILRGRHCLCPIHR